MDALGLISLDDGVSSNFKDVNLVGMKVNKM